jgi:4'-phosphopantetheinyl transferase
MHVVYYFMYKYTNIGFFGDKVMNMLCFMEISSKTEWDVFWELFSGITPEKQQRLNKVRSDIDRKTGTYAEILVRSLICRTLNVKNKDIILLKNEYGKPFLKDFPEFHFNISHTRNALAVAVSGEPIGVDIERIREVNLNISKRVFTENERSYVFEEESGKELRFFNIWTKKEAVAKRAGKGLSMNFKSFDVLSDGPSNHLSTFRIDNYVMSVCSNKKLDGNDLNRITEEELHEQWRVCAI